MRDYTKEANFGLIEELIFCNVPVGGGTHSATAVKPESVLKATTAGVGTSKNFVRIGGSSTQQRRNLIITLNTLSRSS